VAEYRKLWAKMFGLKRRALEKIVAKADICLSTCIGACAYDLEVPVCAAPFLSVLICFPPGFFFSSRLNFPLSSSTKRLSAARYVLPKYTRPVKGRGGLIGLIDLCVTVACGAYSAHERRSTAHPFWGPQAIAPDHGCECLSSLAAFMSAPGRGMRQETY
jgi:hypothetical protein